MMTAADNTTSTTNPIIDGYPHDATCSLSCKSLHLEKAVYANFYAPSSDHGFTGRSNSGGSSKSFQVEKPWNSDKFYAKFIRNKKHV